MQLPSVCLYADCMSELDFSSSLYHTAGVCVCVCVCFSSCVLNDEIAWLALRIDTQPCRCPPSPYGVDTKRMLS